jgi:alkylation response protein AidB-like acyl-CoA dehydrogenase
MLSDRGNGFKIAMNALNVGRIKFAACLDAQRRVITMLAYQTKEYNLIRNSTIWSHLKLADMATSCYAGKVTYQSIKILKTLLVS